MKFVTLAILYSLRIRESGEDLSNSLKQQLINLLSPRGLLCNVGFPQTMIPRVNPASRPEGDTLSKYVLRFIKYEDTLAASLVPRWEVCKDMKKVAIVGVEGSGKTVMLAGLGELYSRPDDKGYFLAPKDFNTSAYVAELMERLRSGSWPAATADDAFQGLEWTLRRRSDVGGRPTDICELSCLDFPGEVYRKAFVETTDRRSEEMQRKVEALWNYIERADSLIVLVNLGDVIVRGLADRRVHESIWVTSAILEQALKERPGKTIPKAAIVLSQADSYAATIEACGGAKGALDKYLPNVYNSFGWLDVFAAYAVDKTCLDDDGNLLPAPGFTNEGLRPIMDWLLDRKIKIERVRETDTNKKDRLTFSSWLLRQMQNLLITIIIMGLLLASVILLSFMRLGV